MLSARGVLFACALVLAYACAVLVSEEPDDSNAEYGESVKDLGPGLGDVAGLLNTSLNNEIKCMIEFITEPYPRDNMAYCNRTWDRILCWPTTQAGTWSVLPCMEKFNNVRYDPADNATRFCHSNGTWDTYSNYSECQVMHEEQPSMPADWAGTFYYFGYCLSLVALTIAITIFIYFKDLRCLRNIIHTHLLLTYFLADLMWIIYDAVQTSIYTDMAGCITLVLLIQYFYQTNFFWMFVEGFYLYMLVVETFSVENIKLRIYVLIGWGAPALVIVIAAVMRTLVGMPSGSSAMSDDSANQSETRHCSWMTEPSYDWVYQCAIIIVLFVNCLFLIRIMWVLITKLRSANNLETQQYRKATKALLVLIPLLGMTYILFIIGPWQGFAKDIYNSVRALLISTQGFTVSLFYCFLNTEVQNTLRHHIESWKTARSIGNRRYFSQNKDCSPKSCTESMRLYNQSTSQYRKRASSASEATMTTYIGPVNNGYAASASRTSNGSGVSTVVHVAGRSSNDSASPFITKENAV